MSPETTVALVELAADVTRAAILAGKDATSPSDFARRLIGIGVDLVPVEELRAALDARAADLVDATVDVAEEAAIASAFMGRP